MIRDDFPIFKNNPDLIFFDSTASSQKPSLVIDGIKTFLENDYSNIHRGSYILAERSEEQYIASKKKVAQFLNASNWREVIYTLNSTYAANLLSNSLKKSRKLEKWDRVLVSIVEHHANVVPWLILKDEIGIEVEFIGVNDDFSLDMQDLESKLDDRVKVVSLTHVSNVTGEIFPLEEVGELLEKKYVENKPYFIIDSSQGFPHMKVDVQALRCDALFCTGHKFGANSGVGILWWKEELLLDLSAPFSGGWAIGHVSIDDYSEAWLPDKFEPGTPNITGAVSVLRALEYIESIWGFEKIQEIEHELVEHFLAQLEDCEWISLIGGKNVSTRASVFSFVVDGVHSLDLSDYLAEKNICIRAGRHCAEPLMTQLGYTHSCRASMYLYNTTKEIDIFFKELKEAITVLKN